MTDNEALLALVASSERVEFLLQTCCCGLAFLAAAAMVGGWLYARRDRDF